DIGNHGDDTVTTIALPFSYTLYDQAFSSINLSSNGNAQFTTVATDFTNVCLPWAAHNYTIFPYWDDLYLVNSPSGIFTSISGTATGGQSYILQPCATPSPTPTATPAATATATATPTATPTATATATATSTATPTATPTSTGTPTPTPTPVCTPSYTYAMSKG